MAEHKLIFKERIDLLRFIIILICVSLPFTAIITGSKLDADPLWLRLSLAGSGIVIVVLSFFSKWVETNLQKIYNSFAVIITVWLGYTIVTTGFAQYLTYGAFLAMVGLTTGFGSIRSLGIFCISYVIFISCSAIIVEEPHVSVINFILEIALLSLILYVFISGFLIVIRKTRETNQNFKALVNAVNETLFMLDMDKRVVEYNKHAADAVLRLFGKKIVVGTKMEEYLIKEEHPKLHKHFEQALTGPRKLETQLKLPNGLKVWNEVNYSPIVNDSGEVKGVLFSLMNISKKKREEEQMQLISRITSTTIGDDFFNSISECLGQLMSVDYVLIAEVVKEGIETEMSTLTFWGKGKQMPHMRTPLAGSSCERILENGTIFHSTNAKQSVPDSELVAQLGIEGYFGVRLDRGNGKPLGVLLFMHSKALPEKFELSTPMLNLIIGRIESEVLRKQVSDKLVASEKRYKSILEHTNEVIFSLDRDGHVNYLSPNFESLFGISCDDMAGQKLNLLVHEEDQDKMNAFIDKTCHVHGSKGTSEFRLINSKDDYLWHSISASPILDENNIQNGIVGMLHNINERKRNGELIIQRERHFRELFEAAPIGMVIFDLGGEIVSVNTAFANTLGFDQKDLIGKHIVSVSHTDGQELNDSLTQRLRDGEIPFYQMEKTYTHRDGRIIHAILKVTLLSESDSEGQKLLAQVIDISERKNAEIQLQKQNVELEKINSQMDHFVYSSAHDLRAPLRSVLGLLSVIRMDSGNTDKSAYYDMMEESINKLDNFIGDIVDFSRNARIQSTLERLNLEEMITGTYSTLKHQEAAANITFTTSIENNFIISDKMRMNVIISNLLSNAIRYSDPKKPRSTIHVGSYMEGEHALITVEDNGVGIDDKYLTQIFDMFFRATETTEGSGLGLYIVKEAANAMCSTIDVESTLGEGTRYTLRIPQMTMTAAAMEASLSEN